MKITAIITALLLTTLPATCGFWVFPQASTSVRHRSSNRLQLAEREAVSHKDKHDTKKKEEYQERRKLWMERYGSLEALQSTFGTGKGIGFFRGDLTPEQTRRLYHTLLPRSLLGLYEMNLMKPQELAPLAYNARVAAKQYARSRCVWYARVATAAFDQYRNLRDRGQLRFGKKSSSMTWEEIWSKYEAQIVAEECEHELDESKSPKKKFNEKDLTMRIYMRILEKSCATNKAFDQMFYDTDIDNYDEQDSLERMGQQLEQDVREVLLGPKESAKVEKKAAKRQEKELKAQLKDQHKQEKLTEKEHKRQLKAEKKREKALAKKGKARAPIDDDDDDDNEFGDRPPPSKPKSAQRWEVLRILVCTRQKFRDILKLKH